MSLTLVSQFIQKVLEHTGRYVILVVSQTGLNFHFSEKEQNGGKFHDRMLTLVESKCYAT